MNLRGNIDLVKPGIIEGWVCDFDMPSNYCEVIAKTQDGKLISEAIASKYREDLEINGIGDGRHAFELVIPYSFEDDISIEVVEKSSTTNLTGSPISIKGKRAPASETYPTLLFDLSDLIVYLEHHDNPTGIQRVVVGVLSAIVQDSLYPLQKIQPVYFDTLDGYFYQLDIHDVCSLIEDIQINPSKRKFSNKATRKHTFLKQATRDKIIAEELNNYVMLMLGAAWVFKGYFIAIRRMKRAGMKFIVLFHDLIPVIMPNMCHRGTAKVFKIFTRNVMSNADIILSVSKNTREDIISYCKSQNIIPPPIYVTKNGQCLKTRFRSINAEPFNGDYVLYVSTIEGRKNHLLAVQVWEKLIQNYSKSIPNLVCVGRGGWCVEQLAEKLRDSNFLSGKVIILSDVADDMLTSLYENCLFTIYPSLYEGWGLPVGESLLFGKVCLASDAASLPEVGGDLALYFASDDQQDFYIKAEKLIFDVQFRSSMEERIIQDFKPIAWSEVAKNVLSSIPEIMQIKSICNFPVLPPGEYSFASIPDIGQEIIDFNAINAVENLFFSSSAISNDNYFYLECALENGLWYDQESWGRWGHIDGNSLMFALSSEKTHILLLRITAPSVFVPFELKLLTTGMYVESIIVKSVPKILRVDLERYTHNRIVYISFNIENKMNATVEGESRQLGLGFCNMMLIEKDNILQRMEVMERMLFD